MREECGGKKDHGPRQRKAEKYETLRPKITGASNEAKPNAEGV